MHLMYPRASGPQRTQRPQRPQRTQRSQRTQRTQRPQTPYGGTSAYERMRNEELRRRRIRGCDTGKTKEFLEESLEEGLEKSL